MEGKHLMMKMPFRWILAALLCFTGWMNLVQASGQVGKNCPCVFRSKTQVRFTQIEKYTIQKEGPCPISAVRFQTVLGKAICSDPDNPWTKNVIQKLDAKTLSPKKGCPNDGSPCGRTPLTSTKLYKAITTPHKPDKEIK